VALNGGKSYLARRIVGLMPKHVHYVEPYAGGLAVLLAKDPEGVSEAVNDLNEDLVNFWRVLRFDHHFAEFLRLCQATPFCEQDWVEASWEMDASPSPEESELRLRPALRSWHFFVYCRQSLAGRMKSFAPLSKTRTRRGMNEQASSWLNAVEGLPAVHERLKRVVVLGPKPALEVIGQQDGPDTLFYLDPPYLHETRTSVREYGECEMTAQNHQELLVFLQGVRGKVMLSGYRSDLYEDSLRHWVRYEWELPNNAAGGESKRRMTECLWLNYSLASGRKIT